VNPALHSGFIPPPAPSAGGTVTNWLCSCETATQHLSLTSPLLPFSWVRGLDVRLFPFPRGIVLPRLGFQPSSYDAGPRNGLDSPWVADFFPLVSFLYYWNVTSSCASTTPHKALVGCRTFFLSTICLFHRGSCIIIKPYSSSASFRRQWFAIYRPRYCCFVEGTSFRYTFQSLILFLRMIGSISEDRCSCLKCPDVVV